MGALNIFLLLCNVLSVSSEGHACGADPSETCVFDIGRPVWNRPQDLSFIQSAKGGSRLTIAGEAPAPSRPNAGAKAETIQFGILCKQFYGMNLAQSTFTADIVLTLKWRDPRALSLLPAGHTSFTISGDLAREKIWLPDIVATNRAFHGIDIISSSITVSYLGYVIKTQRFLAIINQMFDVRAFPFDRQYLSIRVASATLMSDELKLVAINDSKLMGVKDGIFSDEDGLSARSSVFEEEDGSLRKSRGQLVLRVTRDHMAVIQSVIVSEVLLLCVSWAVYFFPLSLPFVMPRVATSVIAFLALMTVSSKTGAMLPSDGRAGLVWIDLFNECCQMLVFLTFGLNILVETIIHSWKEDGLAERMSTELQIIFPCVALVSLGFCCLFRDGRSLDMMACFTRLSFAAGTVFYVGLKFARARHIFSPRKPEV